MTKWICCRFNDLTTLQLYQALQLRTDVFVVEQNCIYSDMDNKDFDPDTFHLLGYQGDVLVAYSRLLPSNVSYDTPSIGRVVTHPDYRGAGLGHELTVQSIQNCAKYFAEKAITISAQKHLTAFYQQHGFNENSEEYLEDGIPHVQMLRKG